MADTATSDTSTATDALQLSGLIVTPDWLAQHLDHPALRLLDARLGESYAESHIPGAVWADLKTLTTVLDGVPGMLLPPHAFAEQMGRLGVDRDARVVIYDDNWGLPAARVLWSLARYGHRQVAVLTGGWDRWRELAYPETSQPFVPPRAQFVVQRADDQIAERSWLLERLDDPATLLIDTRTPGEYAAGHLPGAISWDWLNGVPTESWETLRPAPDLRSELASLGITPDREIVTYCLAGVRAAHTYLLLRDLGYPRVRNYDGSWLEWARFRHPLATA